MKIVKKRILGVLFFTVVLFQQYAIYTFTSIDTRFESATADIDKARVYINQQTFNSGDFAYGTVEFRGGLDPATFGAFIDLGTTPPLAGPIGAGPATPGYSLATYIIQSDLTLGGISLSGPVAPWNTRFGFATTSTMYLQSDLIINSPVGLNFGIGVSTSSGTIDGLDNKIVVLPGSVLVAIYGATATYALTFKNVKFELGESGINTNTGAGQDPKIYMRDVEIIAQMGQTTDLFNATYNFLGTRNIFGYSGTIMFTNNAGFQNHVIISSQSRVTVTPGTTVILGTGSTTSTPYFSFTDATSELYLDNCTVDFSPQPIPQTLALTKGTIYINGNVNFISTNGAGTYQFGDGISQANNLDLIILPGSKLTISDGVTLINANV